MTWPVDGTGGVSAAGRYQVYARWSAATDRPTDVQYTVYHAGGSTVVTVNQQQQGGTWVSLGLFDLAPSLSHRVVLTDATAGRTVADAIKVVPVEIETQMVAADAIKLVANDAEDVLYVQADHLGAAQKMTDDGRAVVWDAAFTPFGEIDSILGSANNNQRFPGQYADGESDLSYNYFRDYDPTIGRYIQSDPIGLAGGLNTYGYVGGNPVNAVDPTGEVPVLVVPLLRMAGGAAFGAATDLAFQAHQIHAGNRCEIDFGELGLAAAAGAGVGTGIGLLPRVASLGSAGVKAGRLVQPLEKTVRTTLQQRATALVARNAGKARVSISHSKGRINVDLRGKPHGNVPTPDVQELKINTIRSGPRAGQIGSLSKKGPTRPATAEDLRIVDRFLRSQGK